MARKNPTVSEVPAMVERDAHESKLDEMHSALYTLGDKIRKPYPRGGDKLLPKKLRNQEPEGSKDARAHIDSLHKAMKGEK